MNPEHASTPERQNALPGEIEARLQLVVEDFLAALQAGERPDRAQVVDSNPELAPWLDERLKLVELVFQAAQDGDAADHRHLPGDRAKRLKCPHCGNQVQLVEPRPKEVTCLNCGSSFRVEPGTTATYSGAGRTGNFGRFQVLELLGRGAFGEVYKARDGELDRFVALKVPRTDYFASTEEAQRFLREARSAAGLRHSSIVQVHEIAHERGTPYIVSDYIEGLTLADLISGGQPGFRESAELVAQLADALDYAHRQRIVHRDIKPSNILLATSQGPDAGGPRFVPYLTDFGLARRDEGEITVTLDGQVLGTPAYMSPEQAAGDHSRVDGRSDVYSLGVVLYELLSGELPFRGSRRMLLHQVLHDEPRPPRTLNERIPRDLETICLKAIAKEPARRYATAADFRDDLRRFLRGDPITARRVGRTERTWRWCRRNPAIAGLAASLTAALIVGTAVSSYLAVAEREARIVAESSEGKALAAHAKTEQIAARSLIRPLDPEAISGEDLNPPEREALWDLATVTDDGLWLRYIDEGSCDAQLVTSLLARSEPAMIAAIGLSLDKRDRAAAFLITRVRDTSLSVRHRAESAFFALELVEQPGALADACTDAIKDAMAAQEETRNSKSFPWRGNHLFWEARSNLEPRTLAALIVSGAPNVDSFGDITAEVLVTLANRLDASEAERTLNTGVQLATQPHTVWPLGLGLAAVAERIDLPSASRVRGEAAHAMSTALIDALNTRNLPSITDVKNLPKLAMKMEPAESSAVLMKALEAAANSTSNGDHFLVLADGLSKAADRLSTTEGSRVRGEAVRVLTERLQRVVTEYEPAFLTEAIAIIVAKMEPVERARLCNEVLNIVIDILRRAADVLPEGPEEVCEGLIQIAMQLDAADTRRVCASATAILIEALRDANDIDPAYLERLIKSCGLLSSHLTEDDLLRLRVGYAKTAQTLVDKMQGTRWDYFNAWELLATVATLSQLATRMDADDAVHMISDAVHVLKALNYKSDESKGHTAAEVSSRGLMTLAQHMTPTEAEDAAQQLIAELHHASSVRISAEITLAVAAVAARIELVQRRIIGADASAVLLDKMLTVTHWVDLTYLAPALRALQDKTGSELAEPLRTEVARALVDRMRKSTNHYELHGIVPALLAVVATMEPAKRLQFCDEASVETLKAIERGEWDNFEGPWPDVLWSLAEQMRPSDATRLFEKAVYAQIACSREDDDALVKGIAFCGSQTAADAAWRVALLVCRDANWRRDASWPPSRYSDKSWFNDLLSDPLPEGAVEGADSAIRGCRLTTPQLVELLKMPTCFGAARRVILDHLERRYGRRFNTIWAFVRFAEEEQLGLDFTTPPVRPDPAKMKLSAP